MSAGSKLRYYRKLIGAVGIRGFVDRGLAKRHGNTIRSPLSKYPMFARPNTSDVMVFDQIFVEREYRCIDHLENVKVIVDAGANVGYSSAYLLSRFPKARVTCIEPDSGNFSALLRNLAPWAHRANLLQAALWHEPGRVSLRDDTVGIGEEWGRQVEADADGTVEALSMNEIIARTGPIDLLKIDIEGAEKHVFAANTDWLGQVRNVVIELHSEEDRRVFFGAVGNRYALSQCEELTVCLSK